jgi:hypothetical protein
MIPFPTSALVTEREDLLRFALPACTIPPEALKNHLKYF